MSIYSKPILLSSHSLIFTKSGYSLHYMLNPVQDSMEQPSCFLKTKRETSTNTKLSLKKLEQTLGSMCSSRLNCMRPGPRNGLFVMVSTFSFYLFSYIHITSIHKIVYFGYQNWDGSMNAEYRKKFSNSCCTIAYCHEKRRIEIHDTETNSDIIIQRHNIRYHQRLG